MTVGEKIKEARKQCGLSQGELAEKMCVSRSAIAKWESGKGLPDVDNLKVLSQLLNRSVDFLLDDSKEMDEVVIHETYDLRAYGKGTKKAKKDRVIRSKFPDADIHTLLGEIKPTKEETIIDNALGFLTDAPFGIPKLINGLKNLDKEFYLVRTDGMQFFVIVTDVDIEIRRLAKQVTGRTFTVDNWRLTICACAVK